MGAEIRQGEYTIIFFAVILSLFPEIVDNPAYALFNSWNIEIDEISQAVICQLQVRQNLCEVKVF